MGNNSSFKTSAPNDSSHFSENKTLQIKEERLDIIKKWIQTGDVEIYKESYFQKKSFTVPVKREELVIEKIAPTPEVTRILLGEEQVEITKHWVNLEDVSIYRQQLADIKHIEMTLKHEVPNVKFVSSPKIGD